MTDPQTSELARKAIKAAIFNLIYNFRFFGMLATKLRAVEMPEYMKFVWPDGRRMGTMATDRKNLFYDPNWVLMNTLEENSFVVSHETVHAAFGHCEPNRIGQRWAKFRDPSGNEFLVWNAAADYTTNGIIHKAISNDRKPRMVMPQGGLFRPDLANNAVERNYDILMREYPHLTVPFSAGSQHPDMHQFTDQEKKMIDREWKIHSDKIVKIEELRAGSPDKIPEYVKMFKSILQAPVKVDWRDILQNFIMDFFKNIHRINPPNKRFIHLGLIEPSISGEFIDVRIYVDTSMSMLSLLPKIYGQLAHIFNSFSAYRVTILEIDTHIRNSTVYEVGEDFSDHPPKGHGGGGTSFVPAFEDMEKNTGYGQSRLLIYVTDGYGAFPSQTPDFDTIWLVPEGQRSPEQFPFGNVVLVHDL